MCLFRRNRDDDLFYWAGSESKRLGGLTFLKSAADATMSVGYCAERITCILSSIIPPLCSTTQKPLHFCLAHIFVCSIEKKKERKKRSGLLSFCRPIKDLSDFSLVSNKAFLYQHFLLSNMKNNFFVCVKNSSCVWQ